MTKICNKCLIEKDVREFYWRDDWNCYRKECKSCIKEYNAKYTDSHKKEKSVGDKNYYLKNKKSINKRNLQYYYDNKEKCSLYFG